MLGTVQLPSNARGDTRHPLSLQRARGRGQKREMRLPEGNSTTYISLR